MIIIITIIFLIIRSYIIILCYNYYWCMIDSPINVGTVYIYIIYVNKHYNYIIGWLGYYWYYYIYEAIIHHLEVHNYYADNRGSHAHAVLIKGPISNKH